MRISFHRFCLLFYKSKIFRVYENIITIGDPSDTHRPPMRHVSVSDEVCRSPTGFRSGMSVSDQACWYPIRHVGLRSGMSVSDGSLIGLQWVSDRSPMGLR